MTRPTQAQKNAAQKALQEAYGPEPNNWEFVADTALTAAAEVAKIKFSESDRHDIGHAKYLVERASPDNSEVCFDYTLVANLLSIIKRLSAAEEVGRKKPSISEQIEEWNDWYKTLPSDLKKRLSINDFKRLGDNFYRIFVLDGCVAAVTIERCAQVADDYYNTHQSNPADAIRALKDKP